MPRKLASMVRPVLVALGDGFGKAGFDIVGQERTDAVQLALLEGHQDHLVGAARALQEGTDGMKPGSAFFISARARAASEPSAT
jgi:hypothetical protein